MAITYLSFLIKLHINSVFFIEDFFTITAQSWRRNHHLQYNTINLHLMITTFPEYFHITHYGNLCNCSNETS